MQMIFNYYKIVLLNTNKCNIYCIWVTVQSFTNSATVRHTKTLK